MEIWHRVGINANKDIKFRNIIDELAIEYKTMPLPGHKIGLIFFNLAESDPRWLQVENLIQEFGASNIYDTIFNEAEILAADWCRLIPVFEQGNVQPEGRSIIWKSQVYQDVCEECGVFGKQIAPFRIKKEPRLGKNSFMSLIGTYSLFGIKEVFKTLSQAAILGYESWDMLLHKSGTPIQNINQVYIKHHTKAALIPENLDFKVCSVCGIKKYLPHKHGYMKFHESLLFAEVDILASSEWFGNGKAAYQEFLISNKLSKLIIQNKWKGVRLKPIKLIM